MRHLRTLPFLSVFGLLAACGSLGDVDRRAPLAVLEGQLTAAAQATPTQASNVRIAVVWMSIDDSGFKVSQDVPATPVFPSQFRLELTDPPPRSAMATRASQSRTPSEPPRAGASAPDPAPPPDPSPPSPRPASLRTADHDSRSAWPADFGVAVGAIVAYEDKNGNGTLDLVDDSATSYVDRVLGVNEELLLVYVEGTAPVDLRDPAGKMPTGGYQLLRKPSCTSSFGEASAPQDTLDRGGVGPNEPGSGAAEPVPMPTRDESCEATMGWLPMSTLYNLPLTAEPRFGSLMCRGRGLDFEGDSVSGVSVGEAMTPGATLPPGPGPDGKFPAKGDPNLYCSPDGRTYMFTKCSTYSEGLCKGTITECSSKGWGLPAGAVPAEWPCTIK